MIAAVGVVVDVFKATKEIFVAIAEIQKGLVVEEQFQAGVRADNAGDIAIVIDRADAATQIGVQLQLATALRLLPRERERLKLIYGPLTEEQKYHRGMKTNRNYKINTFQLRSQYCPANGEKGETMCRH